MARFTAFQHGNFRRVAANTTSSYSKSVQIQGFVSIFIVIKSTS